MSPFKPVGAIPVKKPEIIESSPSINTSKFKEDKPLFLQCLADYNFS